MYNENPSVLDTLMRRKSVRDFIERDVEAEKREQIYQAIMAAPTTENMMMYSVISVNDGIHHHVFRRRSSHDDVFRHFRK